MIQQTQLTAKDIREDLLAISVLPVSGRGPHRIDPGKFELHLIASLLQRIIELRYDAIMAIPLADPPLKS